MEINVVAGVVINEANEVLVAQRYGDRYMAGYWEFPGGKIEAGEGQLEALIREFEEELNIAVTGAEPLIQFQHSYPEKTVHLNFWQVTAYQGTPHGAEGQPIRWVKLAELANINLLPANGPVIEHLLALRGKE